MKHGGDLFEAKARHGDGDPAWLDLSTGLNPHSWPVPDALRHVGWERLPGKAEMRALLAAARAAYRVPDGAGIVAASGTQALIQWLPRLASAGAVAVLGPTYAEHAASWRGAGREVIAVQSLRARQSLTRHTDLDLRHAEERTQSASRSMQADDASFETPAPQAPQDDEGGRRWSACQDEAESIGVAGPTHRVVVNPNNPDGRILGLPALGAMAEECARAGGWLVVDEAYADLDPGMSAARLIPDLPVIVLRSFGKFYGLAGLRLGFAIARPAIAERLRAALGDWPVSGPALAVGAAALADTDWASAMRARLAEEGAKLGRVLGGAGLSPAGGTSLYRLVRHPEAPGLHEHLAAAHIWCRRFAWAADLLRFGLPPDEAALARLGDALARAVHDQGTRTASPRNRAR